MGRRGEERSLDPPSLTSFPDQVSQEAVGPLPPLQGSSPTSQPPGLPVVKWATSLHVPPPRASLVSRAYRTPPHTSALLGPLACLCLVVSFLGSATSFSLFSQFSSPNVVLTVSGTIVSTTDLLVGTFEFFLSCLLFLTHSHGPHLLRRCGPVLHRAAGLVLSVTL